MSEPFVPKGQEGLLVRSPLTFGFNPPLSARLPKPIYTKELDKSHVLGQKDQQILTRNPQRVAYYTRNNPHPFRVCHMKGLLDTPVCCVEDVAEPRYLLSPPSGQDFGTGFRPQGSTRYSANINKGIPAVGVVPVTRAWRDELERKTQNALLHAMGQSPVSFGDNRPDTQSSSGSRRGNMFDHLQDEKLLELLCCILQTNSIPACLAWLNTASESEKTIVLNMIKMAACGELPDASSRPHTTSSQHSNTHRLWTPDNSCVHKKKKSHDNNTTTENHTHSTHPLHTHTQHRTDGAVGGLTEADMEETTFKLPANDTIIKTARELSRLASRNRVRGQVGEEAAGMLGLYPEPELRAGRDIDKMVQSLKKGSTHQQRRERAAMKRQRSASLQMATPTGHHGGHASSLVKRKRSKSEDSGGHIHKDTQPPPPVKVSVTKETIHGAESGGARLRYTSHWES